MTKNITMNVKNTKNHQLIAEYYARAEGLYNNSKFEIS